MTSAKQTPTTASLPFQSARLANSENRNKSARIVENFDRFGINGFISKVNPSQSATVNANMAHINGLTGGGASSKRLVSSNNPYAAGLFNAGAKVGNMLSRLS